MALALGQCCCCPAKLQTGLPDAIDATFAVVSSGDDTGMPADTMIDDCPGGDAYRRWEVSTAIVDLLNSLVFDYTGEGPGECGGCCFHYEARKEYTFDAADANGCGGDYTEPAVLFGDAPFPTTYRNGTYAHYLGTEAADIISGCAPCVEHGPPPEDPLCCPQCMDPSEAAGNEFISWTGTEVSYTPVIGDGTLTICVSGESVSICGQIDMYFGTIAKTGEYTFGSGGKADSSCTIIEDDIDEDTTITCTSSGLAVASFPFSMAADLTAVAGASIWEKIKNYTGWEFDYAYGVCGAYVGCASATEICIGPASAYGNCFPVWACEDCTGVPTTTAADEPIDQKCFYSYGTLAVAFNDV